MKGIRQSHKLTHYTISNAGVCDIGLLKMDDDFKFCFSSRKTLEIFSTLYPEKQHLFCETADLLKDYSLKTPPIEDHKLAFQTLLPSEASFSEEEILEYYNTVNVLRDALILKQEHVDHCFSHLAETRKNIFIKNLLSAYLNSPLSFDLSYFTWELVGEIKDKTKSIITPILFVRDAEASLLFLELAEAFASVSQDCRLINPWEVEIIRQGDGVLYSGSTSACLTGLTEAIRNWKTNTNSEKLWIPFHGDGTELAYLKAFLNHENISYRSLLKETVEFKDPSLEHLIKGLRSNPSIPLKERLKLNQVLVSNRSLFDKESQDVLKTLTARKLLSEEENLLLSGIEPITESQASHENRSVFLFPFMSLQVNENARSLGYCGNSFLSSDPTHLLFTESELEILFQAGYPLPRRSSLIQFRKKMISQTNHLSTEVYSSLSFETLRPFAKAEPIPLLPIEASLEESYTAEIKSSRLSATQLETYSECPAKYFFLNRMRLRRPMSFQESYALVLGQSVHLALENACKNKFPLQLENLEQEYQKALEQYVPEHERETAIGTILRAQFKSISEKVLALEKTLEAYFGPGVPMLIEEPFEIEVAGLKFTGKIDRVDLREGRAVILDYKTGNVDFTPEHIRKGSNFQALLYLLAVQEKVKEPLAGMLFYDLKVGELRRGLLIEEEVSKEAKKFVTRGHTLSLDKFYSLSLDGLEKIKSLAAEIAQGSFQPAPSATSCGYCEASGMCRRAYGYL